MEEVPDYVPNKDEIKSKLPLAYACARLGIGATLDHKGLCPFHADSEPSFNLYQSDDGQVRWSCFPCGINGDVFDLIQKIYNCSFLEAIDKAREILEELPEDYQSSVQTLKKRVLGPDDWAQHVNDARVRAAQQDHAGILSARIGFAPVSDPTLCYRWDRYLRDVWGLGITPDGDILLPHFSQDGRLVACKVRSGDGSKKSLEGSEYEGQLYGAWLGHRQHNALITEGESDCIYAGFTTREEQVPLDVYAIPSGVGQRIEDSWIQFLKRSRTVYLCLDPDEAGVRGTWTWLETLLSADINVKICALPLGRDLRDAKPSIRQLIETAREALDVPSSVTVHDNGYFRPDKDGDVRRVTNWYVEPIAQLAEGDPGYDVKLNYRGTEQQTVLRLTDLTSARDIKRWCNRHGLLFTGREDDLQRIAEHIAWRGSVVPEVYQTDQVGIQEPPAAYGFAGPSVVFPKGYVGKMPWRYVPSTKTADVSEKILLPTEGPFLWSWLEDFLKLNRPDVTQPLLSWAVASARRPSATEFPLLFIGGSSGVGKSTLARLMLRLMGSQIEVDLGAITPFILMRTLAASKSLPVFVDEWTKLSRQDVRLAFQGAIPVLYTGGGAERGQADLSSTVYHLTAPTVIAGEDTFMLDREIERTVCVSPSRDGQNHEALARVATAPLERFGQLLHTWLTTRTDLPSLRTVTSSRPEYNSNILKAGWETLLLFLEEASHSDPSVPHDLPEVPDLSSISAPAEEQENVYEQALLAGMSMSDNDRHRVVWSDSDGRGTWVRFQVLTGLIQNRNVDIQLPGGSRSMKAYFEERHGKLELGPAVSPPGSLVGLRAWLIPGYQLPESDDKRNSFNFE